MPMRSTTRWPAARAQDLEWQLDVTRGDTVEVRGPRHVAGLERLLHAALSRRIRTAGMKSTVMTPVKAFTLIALGLAIAAMGIYVADADDAPGAAAIGMLLMV